MKVILMQNVPKLGSKFDIKEVSSGYAANFLFPRGLAENATPAKLKQLDTQIKQSTEEKKIQEELLTKNIESLNGVEIEINVKANEKGHLFKGIHQDEIVEALKEQGHIDITSDMIVLENPIKAVGDFVIKVKVGEKEGKFKLSVSPLK